ncbi:polysaccharide pyruvyl transferase family protein [Aegicerativicinus sediminis]
MGISKFIKRNLSSLQRNRSKKRVIEEVKSHPQSNEGVINIHRIDYGNVGDLYCAPHHYFKELKNSELDIFDFKSADPDITKKWINKISSNSLVIGGGGLLNRSSFEMQMKLFEYLSGKNKKTVLWGVGHNQKQWQKNNKIQSYNIDTSKFGLVGVRDHSMKEEWVPCVSCMHPIFDTNYDIKEETGLIFHKKTIKNKSLLNRLNDYPSTSNTTNLDNMISFIGSHETVVTDSYHAMYWATLLGRKVLAVPNSSKFFDFKYNPIFTTFKNFENEIKKAQSYTGVLEECREINMEFSRKVFDYLNI